MNFADEDIHAKGKKVAEKITITTQCLSCGITYTENFPWYKENEFLCPECGGEIDDSPILEFVQTAIQQARKIQNEQ